MHQAFNWRSRSTQLDNAGPGRPAGSVVSQSHGHAGTHEILCRRRSARCGSSEQARTIRYFVLLFEVCDDRGRILTDQDIVLTAVPDNDPNQTALVEIVLQRHVRSGVFALTQDLSPQDFHDQG